MKQNNMAQGYDKGKHWKKEKAIPMDENLTRKGMKLYHTGPCNNVQCN